MEPFIDSHVHFDVLLEREVAAVDWFVARRARAISWAYAYEGVQSVSDLTKYYRRQCETFSSLRPTFEVHYLVGIHPRNLPENLRPEQVGELLEPWVLQPGCVGLGEIGIDSENVREAEIFQAQLEWSAQLPETHILGVHTPRADKVSVTHQILELIKRHAPRPERVLVDHCILETLPDVLDTVGFAGISLSPNKSTVEEAVVMLLKYADQCGRIMCNTDSAVEMYEPLLALQGEARLSAALRDQVMRKTAETAFSLD